MTIKVIEGNLLDAKEDLILHQTNCKGVMGSGIAEQIKYMYPFVYQAYNQRCHSENMLGKASSTAINDTQHIINVFGQYGYGKGRQTNYEALYTALEKVSNIAKEMSLSIAIPFKMGCGRGGGNWSIVLTMIETLFNGVEVVIYKYNPN